MEVEQQDELAEGLINNLKRKEVKKAKKALENGADPNYIGPEGFAAIHLAAGLDGNAGQQLLSLMLMYGGNPNLKSSDNETALHVAVMWNREIATRMLLSHGADPAIRNSDGLTAFDLAESTSDNELKCLDLLRSSCLGNSSESDGASSERSVLIVPTKNSNLAMKKAGLNAQHRLPSKKSNEFPDTVDGIYFMGSQVNSVQGSGSPPHLKTSPNLIQYPCNPMWYSPTNDMVGVPYNPQTMGSSVFAPQISPSLERDGQRPQKDSFFDISLAGSKTRDSQSSYAYANVEQYHSDTQDSINTAFTWDSDIDSSTSYFSLPKHSLKGLITELKDGEERVMTHRGINGEASVIIGSDFESRISLGEIPLSLIKNTNESIVNEQLRKSHGRKSVEKLFLRRAKLNDMHSSKRMKNQMTLKSTSEVPSMSPINMRMQRPTYFRSPFPLIRIPSHTLNQNITSSFEYNQNRTEKIPDNVENSSKVDKTTQKYLDMTEGEVDAEAMPNRTQQTGQAMESQQSIPTCLPHRMQGLARQAQVGPSVIHQGSSTSNLGSADINVRTPTTDETFSQPGNEETEIESSLLHTIGSPRALYNEMNETPTTMRQTLFDRTFLKSNIDTQEVAESDMFNFSSEITDKYDKGEVGIKSFSKIQRKIDVLNQTETDADVFPPEIESVAGESDGGSSGYGGDLSQTSSPDDILSARSLPKFDLKNSPSVTMRNKQRKAMLDGDNSRAVEKLSSTDCSDVAEAEVTGNVNAALPASPRKRLNGVTSSSDEIHLPKRDEEFARSPIPPKKNMLSSPGHRIRQRVDHTFEGNSPAQSPLLPGDLRAYHRAQLEKPTTGRKQWEREHKNGCVCELCMTRKGQAAVTASLPYCEHDQCRENNEDAFNDVNIEFDWKDVSLMESTNTDHSVVVSEEIKSLNAEELKTRLVKAGEKPGPITGNTKNIYMKHLARVEAGSVQKEKNDSSSFMEYVPEMRQELKGISNCDMSSLEDLMIKNFENPQQHKWREGVQKTSFNYLLLDPRVISPLADKSRKLSDIEMFSCFVRSIFYVGKGKESRPYEHLHDAIKMKKSNLHAARASDKLNMILNIWQSGYGVISLHVFHNIIPVEAYTREACMIEALGLKRLTNLKKGDFYGDASSWGKKQKRQLGIYLLKKALQILLVEGQRQIKEADL